jgi:hypothetical protein
MPTHANPRRFTKTGKLWDARLPVKSDRLMGLVDTGLHEIGTGLEIEILGELFKTTVIEESPYDLQNEKLRA